MVFDDYMEMCLYDPEDGFFSAGPVRSGKKADFVTSPELSWAFALCVGNWAEANRPSNDCALIEIGAGSGSLMANIRDLWESTSGQIYAVERSSAAREALRRRFIDVNVVGSLDEIPRGIDAVVIANEVLDNIPAALAIRMEHGWFEIAVGLHDDELGLAQVPAREEVVAWCDSIFDEVEEGVIVSVQLGVDRWISQLVEHLGSVAICFIDYGDESKKLLSNDVESVVRSYRQHRQGIDWLRMPGECDITVDVNFTGVLAALRRAGLAARLTDQRAFCLEYGIVEVIADARDREHFAASLGNVMDQLRVRSERLDYEALVDPNGLGAFKVLLVEP